jgi:hypothetical protein
MDVEVRCPYCGEVVNLSIDDAGGVTQRYVEDCPVCCRPMDVLTHANEEDGDVRVHVQRLDA